MDLPTRKDLFRVARDEVLSGGSNLTRGAVESDGTDANALANAGVGAADEVVGQLAQVAAGLFSDSAKGSKLDRLVLDRTGNLVVRKPASPAFASVTFTLPSANPAQFGIPAGNRLSTTAGAPWVTLQSATFPAGATTLSVAARSSSAGLSQQVAVGAVASIVDYPLGAPQGMTVTNPLASSGADDREADPDYASRYVAWFPSARRGVRAAIEQAALAYPGVRRATAFEATDMNGRPARFVQLVVADAFTDALASQGVDPPSYQAQSAVFAAQVAQGLDDARAFGIFVQVLVAQVALLPVRLGLTFLQGADVDTAATQARAAVVAYVNGLRPGAAFVYADAVASLRPVAGLFLAPSGDMSVISPPGNVLAASPLSVFRTNMSLVSATGLGS